MRDPTDSRRVISARGHDLEAQEISDHIKAGMFVSRLGLIFDDRISFVLDDTLKLRKLKFLDLVMDRLDSDRADAAAETDARFALMSLELARLFDALDSVLGFES